MSGEISARSCPSLDQCAECEFGQALQERVEQQLEVKAENRRRKRQVAEQTEVRAPADSRLLH